MTGTLHVRCDNSMGSLRLRIDEHIEAPWTVIFGPSGSGKSTLLRLVAGLYRPHGAAVVFNGRDLSNLPAHRRRVALVSQAPSLFPHLSVRENIAFGACVPVDPLLDLFALTTFANAGTRTLSGGEAQRVSIARALATAPHLLLLDESFTGMHRTLRHRLASLLRQVQQQRSAEGNPMPIVSVTHDVAEALACGNQALRIEDGHIVQRGMPSNVLAEDRKDLLIHLSPSPD